MGLEYVFFTAYSSLALILSFIFFSFVSDDIFVINDIIEVEKIALNSVISLKMISAPALHPYCKVAWQF